MLETTNLTNHFLIAMPTLEDPNFNKTVTYLFLHNEQGAMGVVINRPIEDVSLADIFENMQIKQTLADAENIPVYQGGPVETERGFVVHRPPGEWDAVMNVEDRIGVATSRDIITSIAQDEGPEDMIITLGYAGWAAGQLEQEMAANAWLSSPADESIIFETPPEERWHAAAASMGIDLSLLSTQAGHG